MGKMVLLGHKDPKDPLARLVHQVRMGLLGLLVLKGQKETKETRVMLGLLERRELLDLKAPPVKASPRVALQAKCLLKART